MSRHTKAIAVVILVLTLGLHWAFLQSVAWVTMFVRYAQQTTLQQALAQTFDGKNPCAICHLVENGKKSDEKQSKEKRLSTEKFELLCEAASMFWFRSPLLAELDRPLAKLTGRQAEPPSPPPRLA